METRPRTARANESEEGRAWPEGVPQSWPAVRLHRIGAHTSRLYSSSDGDGGRPRLIAKEKWGTQKTLWSSKLQSMPCDGPVRHARGSAIESRWSTAACPPAFKDAASREEPLGGQAEIGREIESQTQSQKDQAPCHVRQNQARRPGLNRGEADAGGLWTGLWQATRAGCANKSPGTRMPWLASPPHVRRAS